MFAILISPENLEEIRPFHDHLKSAATLDLDLVLQLETRWYYVRGWHDKRGKAVDWVIFPESHLKHEYEIDLDHARTEWDQIVRK